MDAHKALIANIFNSSTLIEVPFFQRTYVWQEDLWSRLIEDMEYISLTNKQHFLGSIILKEGLKPAPGDMFTERRTIVDGQQRLTTFLILLKVLCLKQGQTAIFDWQFRIIGQSIALRHGKNDVDAFEKVMSATTAEKITNPVPGSRIIEAYNYFVEHIDKSKMDVMSVMKNTQFVRIDLDANEDEQQIFDSINSLGVNLTTSELLKNYFFSRETVNEYERTWESVFEKDDDAKAYWDIEIETGRVKRALIDIFFDAYFQIFVQDKKFGVTAEDKIMYERQSHLSQSYQHFISSYCSGNKNVILDRLKEYAECYMRIFRPEYCEMNTPADFGIERLNVIIFGLKTSTLIPYVLYIEKNVADADERAKIYGILESYIMRRLIVHAPGKNYNKLFTSLILNTVTDADALREKLGGDDATSYIPDDAELRLGFDNAKLVNLHTRGIIYLMESRIRPANSSTVLHGFDRYSLEHLMPKKWRNNWTPCKTDDLARQRDSILLTLGNLAIIPQSLNASIRDGDWQTKKSGKGNKPGLDLCAAGLITVHDALQENSWDEDKIHARAEWLFETAKDIWRI